MRFAHLSAALVFATACVTPAPDPVDIDHGAAGRVLAVPDGDTLVVQVDGAEQRVRLIGINAPERGECFADEAQQFLDSLVGGRTVTLAADVSDRDRYDRLLRYVSIDDRVVNEALVRSGHALANSYPPDVALDDVLVAAESEARTAGRGMWAAAGCLSPAAGSVVLVEVEADAPGPDHENPNGEWVVVRNETTETIALAGWTLRDGSSVHRFAFPEGVDLAPGGMLTVYSGCGEPAATALFWCVRDTAVWDNDGDTAMLLDRQGAIVDRLTY